MMTSGIPIQPVQAGVVVASLQTDLEPSVLKSFQNEILEHIADHRVTGVVLDASGVEILDMEDADSLVRTLNMVSVMGARPVLVGLRPGVVAALVELGLSVGNIETALTLDQGLKLLDGDA